MPAEDWVGVSPRGGCLFAAVPRAHWLVKTEETGRAGCRREFELTDTSPWLRTQCPWGATSQILKSEVT